MRVAGSGSLVRREGRDRSHCRKWQMRVYTVRADGSRELHTREFKGSWTAGREALAAFAAELRAEGEAAADATFDEYAGRWVAAKEAAGRGEATVKGARTAAAALGWHLGGMRMRDIRPSDVERAYAALRAGESPSGRPLSDSSIAAYSTRCSNMFSMAVRDGVAASNPFESACRPRPDTPEKRAMTAAQARALLSRLDASEPHGCAVALCLTLGLRASEAAGARRCDVSGGALHVARSKTPAGVRTIPMPAPASEAVAARMAAQDAEFAACGLAPSPDEPLAATPARRSMGQVGLSGWWRDHRDSLGAGGWTLHELRHTFLTLLAESGADPKTMQALAGHSSPLVTLGIYTHVHDERKRQAMGALEGLLGTVTQK